MQHWTLDLWRRAGEADPRSGDDLVLYEQDQVVCLGPVGAILDHHSVHRRTRDTPDDIRCLEAL